jgi:hypothetical protein
MDEDLNRRLARIETAIELLRDDMERQAGLQAKTQSLMIELMEVLTRPREGEPLEPLLRAGFAAMKKSSGVSNFPFFTCAG